MFEPKVSGKVEMEAETFPLDSQREELVLFSAPQPSHWRAAVGWPGCSGGACKCKPTAPGNPLGAPNWLPLACGYHCQFLNLFPKLNNIIYVELNTSQNMETLSSDVFLNHYGRQMLFLTD